MPAAKIIAGPGKLYYYQRNSNVLTAAAALLSGDCASAAETPAAGIDGATRIQASTAYNLAVVWFGAHPDGGLAVTTPPTDFSFTTGVGHNAIKVTKAAPAGAIAGGLLVNGVLAAINATPLSVRNGSAGNAEIVCYYEPSALAVGRTDITTLMAGASCYGWDRLSFGETSGDTVLNIAATTVTVQRNSGTDIPLVTGFNVDLTATLLASGKQAMAQILNGIATAVGGLKTNQEASFGYRGLGTPTSRPIEVVGPGENAGEEDSVIIYSALKISDQQINKAWSKTNASTLPVKFVNSDDALVTGIHGTYAYVKN